MSLMELTDSEQFEPTEGRPILYDFWAPWCGPCKRFMPLVEEFAQKNEEALDVVKVNVEDHIEFASQFKVSNIPCFVLVIDGDMVYRFTGANKDELDGILDKLR